MVCPVSQLAAISSYGIESRRVIAVISRSLTYKFTLPLTEFAAGGLFGHSDALIADIVYTISALYWSEMSLSPN